MIVRTFSKGGVHPPENKLTAASPVVTLPLPVKVFVPVHMNLGAPAKLLVEKGESVKTGQLIAKGEAFISASVHSPVTGKIIKIEEVTDQSGYRKMNVQIETIADEWIEGVDTSAEIKRECDLTPEQIINKISEMGVVGLGGATFPTHVKLMVPQGKKAEVLIINGVECEPYLTSDHRLMLERGEEIMVGISILMKGLGVNKAVIGIEKNKPDAIAHLEKLAKSYPGISVTALKVKYPQGAEKQLIKAVAGREVPSLKLPIEVGCVVNNVGTALAVYEAVQKNKPLIERVVTVTGKSLSKPSNLLVRIGTPVGELISFCGGLPDDAGKIISGGPMMGKALNNADVPVVKGTSGILVMKNDESRRRATENCIRCAKCVSVCPMGLEPYLLERLVNANEIQTAADNQILDCMECGSCQFICPSSRPLLDYIRLGKSKASKLSKK